MKFKQLWATYKPTKAQMEMATAFLPSAACFGLAGMLGMIYLSDWRIVTDRIPIYNTKYPKEEKK